MIPTNRKELQELIKNPSQLKNVRYPTDELLYKMYRKYAPKEDQILLLKTQISNAKTQYGICSSTLTHNNFEYRQFLSKMPKTRHYLLFFNDPIDPKIEMEKWQNAMNMQAEFDYFIQDKANQSVPEINHYHIFMHFI